MSDYIRSIPKLKDYDVSETVGFLLEKPEVTLPSYFAEWEELATRLEYYLKRKEVRKLVDQMSLLDNYDSELSSDPVLKRKQLCLAYVFLTFIGSAFIWQDGEIGLVKVIPKQLAIPWHGISKILGFKPVPCMASVALNNYRLQDETKPISLENLEVICSVPGGRWFFLVTIQVEVDAVPGIKAILKAKQAVVDCDDEILKRSLQEMTDSIEQIKKTSKRMYEDLDRETFYNVVRPYLAGYGGKESKIPDGLIFEGVSETPEEAIGGSAAQSSTMQSFDEALGIKHDSESQKYLDKVREYMPPKHVRFIESLGKGPSIKSYVTASQNTELMDSYRSVVDALYKFRKLHRGLVESFIFKPAGANSAKTAAGEKGTGGTGANSAKTAAGEKGTGGTDPKVFLESVIKTTEEARDKIEKFKSEE